MPSSVAMSSTRAPWYPSSAKWRIALSTMRSRFASVRALRCDLKSSAMARILRVRWSRELCGVQGTADLGSTDERARLRRGEISVRAGRDDPVLPGALGLVHQGVRIAQQVVDRADQLRHAHDPHAEGDVPPMPLHLSDEDGPDPPEGERGVLGLRVGKERRELVTAHAREYVGRPQARGDRLGDPPQ